MPHIYICDHHKKVIQRVYRLYNVLHVPYIYICDHHKNMIQCVYRLTMCYRCLTSISVTTTRRWSSVCIDCTMCYMCLTSISVTTTKTWSSVCIDLQCVTGASHLYLWPPQKHDPACAHQEEKEGEHGWPWISRRWRCPWSELHLFLLLRYQTTQNFVRISFLGVHEIVTENDRNIPLFSGYVITISNIHVYEAKESRFVTLVNGKKASICLFKGCDNLCLHLTQWITFHASTRIEVFT